MKRWVIVLLTLAAVPALAAPDPDDRTEQPAKKPKKKKPAAKKKKDTKKKPDVDPDAKPANPEIDMAEDPTTKPAPAPAVTVDATAGMTAGPDDPNAAAMAKPVETPLTGGTPIELTRRPIVFQKGRFDAGGYLSIPRGPDYTSTTANAPIGKWIGLNLRGEYGLGNKLDVGFTLALAPINSSSPDDDTKKFGGIAVDGKYAIVDDVSAGAKEGLQVAGHATLGYLARGAPELGAYSFPLYGDLEPAVGLGVLIQKNLADDKAALLVEPRLFFQASAHATVNAQMMTELDAFFAIQVPVALMYQVKPNVDLGLRTGIYTGAGVSFSPDDGFAIPAVAEGVVTVMKNQLDLGVDLGLGNLTGPRSAGPLETFFVGLFATYRTK